MSQTTTTSPRGARIMPLLLALAGLSILIIGLAGNLLGISSLPGLSANQLALAIIGLVTLATGAVRALPASWRPAMQWLVVVATAAAAAMAADLVYLQTTLDGGIRQAMVLVAFGGALLLHVDARVAVTGAEIRRRVAAIVADRFALGRFALIVLQLGLLVLVMGQFQLENQAVYHNIMSLAFYGFLLNFALPLRYRLPFFSLISLAAMLGILGLENGIWLLTAGLGLIGIAHLPIAFRWRVALLLAVGLVLGLSRGQIIASPVPAPVWPILGSMFMFRLIIYVYDLKFSKKEVNLAQALSYFFMFPNLVFPFFPVVDFSTMRRTHYGEKDSLKTYQTGVQWILRGVVQLVIYRVINYYLVIAPEQVVDTGQLVRFVLLNFPLYLRISGQFHVIVGILRLFGFGLPETNNRFFLAAGFTDLWRRANIYWKDFMQKIFFYPVHFRLKRLGAQNALVLASAFVILVTWFLHGYQWFWLRGTWFLTANDILFWTLLGSLLVLNIVVEARFGRRRSLGKREWTFRDFASLTLKTAGTFTTLSLLWTMWTSPSIGDFATLWQVVDSLQDVLILLGAFAGLLVVFGVAVWFLEVRQGPSPLAKPTGMAALRPGFLNVGLLFVLIALASPATANTIGGKAGDILSDLSTARLSDRDAALLQRGYYEDLVGVDRFNADLWDIYTRRPSDWPLLQDTEAAVMTGDFELIRLEPGASLVFHGAQFTVNSAGMRDKEYDLTPAPGTYRIALLGPSYVMGSGVADNETFDWLLEDRLNASLGEGAVDKVEVLNFGVAGFSALQELWQLQNRVLDYQPDAIIFIAHHLEEEVAVRNLANSARNGVDMPYEYLRQLVEQAGVTVGLSQVEAERLLQPYSADIVQWTYEQVMMTARENNIEAVYVYMPTPELGVPVENVTRLLQMAEEAGFPVLDLSDAFDGHDLDTLIVATWDRHPNAKGHRLLAESLYKALQSEGLLPGNG